MNADALVERIEAVLKRHRFYDGTRGLLCLCGIRPIERRRMLAQHRAHVAHEVARAVADVQYRHAVDVEGAGL